MFMKKTGAILLAILLIVLCFCGCSSQEEINKNADEVINQYNKEQITYAEAYSDLVKYSSKSKDASYIEQQMSVLAALMESKENYIQAKKAFDSGNYEAAVIRYGKVSGNDDNYNAAKKELSIAQENYIKSVDEDAEQYMNENKYSEAIKVYENSKKVYNDGKTDNKISDIEEKYKKKQLYTFKIKKIIERSYR